LFQRIPGGQVCEFMFGWDYTIKRLILILQYVAALRYMNKLSICVDNKSPGLQTGYRSVFY